MLKFGMLATWFNVSIIFFRWKRPPRSPATPNQPNHSPYFNKAASNQQVASQSQRSVFSPPSRPNTVSICSFFRSSTPLFILCPISLAVSKATPFRRTSKSFGHSRSGIMFVPCKYVESILCWWQNPDHSYEPPPGFEKEQVRRHLLEKNLDPEWKILQSSAS